MTTPLSLEAPHAAPRPGARRLAGGLRLVVAAGSLAGLAALGWQGGPWGLLGALGAAAVVPLLQRLQRRAPAGHQAADVPEPLPAAPRVSGGRVGAEVMVSQVVPVWSKQMDITREAAAEGMGKLLEGFAQMAGALGDLANNLDNAQATLEVGAVESALAEDSPARLALAALLAPSQRAFDQRDAAVAELSRCSETMHDLRQLGRQAREVAKHTRLVAFNASIEASRGSHGLDAGSQAVANETRMLGARMAEVGEQIERTVSRLEVSLNAGRLRGETGDTTPAELRLELEVQARTALTGLVSALGGSMRNSGVVKESTETLRLQLEESFVNFQFGDRLSQMLAIVGSDMQNFARWVSANPYATQTDAAEWLANLEASYTMDEQRARHHGNVHIDRGSEIEFF